MSYYLHNVKCTIIDLPIVIWAKMLYNSVFVVACVTYNDGEYIIFQVHSVTSISFISFS